MAPDGSDLLILWSKLSIRFPVALSEEMIGVWMQVAFAHPHFVATSRMNLFDFH